MTTDAQRTLGRILLLDAATCAAMGVLLIAAAGPLAELTGLSANLLLWAGAILVPVALYIAAVARRAPYSAAVWLVILGNVGWVVASLAVLALAGPNAIGAAFVLVQAAVVVVLTWLEAAAWRAASPARSAAT